MGGGGLRSSVALNQELADRWRYWIFMKWELIPSVCTDAVITETSGGLLANHGLGGASRQFAPSCCSEKLSSILES